MAEVDKNYTSQICPNCGSHTGKKLLSVREHNCPDCGYKTHRDVASAQVIRNRGIENALGHSVLENACGDGLAGAAMSSQESVKQELLNASLRIPVSLERGVSTFSGFRTANELLHRNN